MRFQEIDNTRLTLSLASSDDDDIHAHGLHHRQENKRSKPNSQMIWHSYLPSRFLGSLPMELQLGYGKDNNNRSSDVMMNSQASPTGPSLFRFRSKREKDEVKMERQEKPDSSRDEYIVLQDEEFGTRKKLKLTKDQSVVLEDSFKEHTTLNSVFHHLFILNDFLVLFYTKYFDFLMLLNRENSLNKTKRRWNWKNKTYCFKFSK
ncbi:unnamed protein product [Cuscuta europaea]|uniref:Uncharacterized protein n=1 Tax=Cuscuta europaea TaxID=41803 RepID=A0A9P1E4S0_CUSEU|nr:unnamed protein product [Cuscuta europaea]